MATLIVGGVVLLAVAAAVWKMVRGPQKGRVQLRRRLLALLRMRTLIFGGRAFALPPPLRPHIAFAPRLCYTVRDVIRQGGLFWNAI